MGNDVTSLEKDFGYQSEKYLSLIPAPAFIRNVGDEILFANSEFKSLFSPDVSFPVTVSALFSLHSGELNSGKHFSRSLVNPLTGTLYAEQYKRVENVEGDLFLSILYPVSQSEAANNLRKSNERFRILFEESRDPILLIDNDGIFLDCNNAAILSLGYNDKSGIVGKTPEDISPSRQRGGIPSKEAAREFIGLAYTKGYSQFEWLHEKKDGTPAPFTITLTLLEYESSKYLLVHWYNLEERIRLEEELKDENEQLATIMQTIVDGVVLVNSDGKIIYANNAAERILDLDKSVLLGTYYIDNRWKQSDKGNNRLAESDLPLTSALLKQKSVFAHEHKITDGTGKEKWLSVNAAPLYAKDETLLGAVASFRDITGEMKMKESVRESMELSNAVISALKAHIAVITPGGEIIAVNEAWKRFASENNGDEAKTGVGTNYFENIEPGSEGPYIAKGIRKVIEGENDSFTHEYICETPHCNRWFKLTALPLPHRSGAVLAHADITERKNIEVELKHKEALLSSFFNSSGAGMFIVDRYLNILRANKQLGIFSGEESILTGTSLKDLNSRFTGLHKRNIERVFAEGEAIYNLEMRMSVEERAPYERYWHLSYFPITTDTADIIAVGCMLTDVTELKQVQFALEDSEWKFRQLFDSSSDGVVSSTLTGQITSTNKAFATMLGYPVDELVNKTVFDITPEKYHHTERDIIREKVLMSGASGLLEKEYRRKDGSHFPAELNIYLETDKRGKPRGVVAFIRDISERKRRSDELIQNEQRFRTIFENSVEPLVILEGTRIRLANTAFLSLFRVTTPDKILGTDYLLLHQSEWQPRIKELLQALTDNEGNKTVYECEGIQKNSHRFLMSVVASSYMLSGITYVICVLRDITVQRRMEDKVRESEAHLRAILNAVQDSILLVDRIGTIVSVNETASHGLGTAISDVEGKNLFLLLPHEDAVQLREQILRSLETGTSLITEFIRGGCIYQRIMYPVKEKGLYTKVVIYTEDITERKQNEELLGTINEQLRNHIAAKDKFFSILAHDLKSPYLGILGLMEMLLDKEEPLSQVQHDKYLVDLQNALNKQYGLIHHLLQWSRMQTGRTEFRPVTIDVTAAVEEVYESLKLTATNKDLFIHRVITPGLTVYADPDMTRSILINLLGNAIKFSHRSGDVRILAFAKGDNAEISIQDYGIGMSPEHLSKLFDISVNSSRPGTAGEKGTGLGLLITKEMAEKQGGTLTAESTEGEGSIFRVHLPLNELL